MQDQYDDIGAIIARYPDLNPEENRILKEWIDISETNRKIFEDLTSPGYLLTILKRYEHIEAGKKRRWERVLAGSAKPGDTAKTKIAWLRRWQPYVAAASVILIAGLLYYTWQGKQQATPTEPTPAVVKVNDAEPGEFKAKLTLGDNSEIVLDSAVDKVLLQQAGIKVVNKDGALVYEYTGAKKADAVLYNTLTTARGQTYVTVLSDGTKVWLNSHSSIKYPMTFNGDIRSVETTGEVYFEVAAIIAQLATGQKGKRPFIVHAPGVDVEVLGTHFNINSYADEPLIKTTLLEGIVKVVAPANAAQGGERKAVYLAPGEQARLVKQNQALSKTKDVDAEGEAAWRFGMFQFNKADLVTVMRQLGRWYDVEIEYRGNVPEHEFIGTIPRSLNLSKVLQLLEKQDMHFTIDGKKIIVTHK